MHQQTYTEGGPVDQFDLYELKNGKAAGPDGIRKEDLLVDPIMTAHCLTLIFNASLSSSKLPDAWKVGN